MILILDLTFTLNIAFVLPLLYYRSRVSRRVDVAFATALVDAFYLTSVHAFAVFDLASAQQFTPLPHLHHAG